MPTHPMLPELFGRYRILKKLGEGGMGAVYLAEDAHLDRRVALKVPLFGAEDGLAVERFKREARIAARLYHPNLCAVFDVGEVGGVCYFTMPFVDGTPLSRLIRADRPWPSEAAAELVRQVALAVALLHQNGVVHRDLKPSNIMVRPTGEPVLMDFGLARSYATQSQRLTNTGAPLGTPAYMSPEQVSGDPDAIGPATDVYSLGMILYELLTGRLPFEGPLLAVFAQVLHSLPEAPSRQRPGLNPALEAICLKALAKKPAERYPSAAALAAALEPLGRRSAASVADPGDPELLTAPTKDRSGGDTVPPSLPGKGPVPRRVVRPSRPEKTVPQPQPGARASRTGLVLAVAAGLVLTGSLVALVVLGNRPEDNPKRGEVTRAKTKPAAKDNNPPKDGPSPVVPATVASLRLLPLEPLTLAIGQFKTIPVRVKRENCSGAVTIRSAGTSPGVTIRNGEVATDAEGGSLEVVVDSTATAGERTLRLLASAGAVQAEGELRLTIQAAPRRGRFGFGPGLVLAANKSVQIELKLTKAQSETVDQLAKKINEKIRETFGSGRLDREKFSAVTKEAKEEAERTLATLLTGVQLKRYKQLQTQMMGLRAFSDEGVLAALKLTEAQKNHIKTIKEDADQKYREQTKNLGRSDIQKRREIRQKLDREATSQILTRLTSGQKKAWTDLIGKPFELK